MKRWLTLVFIALIMIYNVTCQADGFPKTIPLFTGDINDPQVFIVDFEDEYYIVEYDGVIYYYPLE